jgi:hypothetical protein
LTLLKRRSLKRVAVVVLVEMIVFWGDHSRSLVTGLGRSKEARNLAEAVAVDLHEFKDAPAGSTFAARTVCSPYTATIPGWWLTAQG